jgi:hypothetical protein
MSVKAEEIWEILHELVQSGKETDRQMQETDRQMRETDRRMQETDRRMQETDRRMQETDHAIKKMNGAIGRLGNRLGEFVEEMVRPAAVRLFRERGIDVHQVFSRVYVERDGEEMEIDLLAVNDTDAVLIEVKSELKTDDIHEHLERLAQFKKMCPQYAGLRTMGAVAAMVAPDNAARFAYRKGLFVLGQNGDGVVIRNNPAFRPTVW